MNYVSINRVAEQVYKSGLNVDEINFTDMIEWVGEAIAKIGVIYAYTEVITNGVNGMPDPVVVTNYRGVLPDDIFFINGVRDHDSDISFIKEVGNFKTTYGTNNRFNASDSTMLAYRIEDGYIYTNVEETELEISYLAFQTDGEGYPMIPDDERYISAVKAYVMYVIAYRMWLQDKIEEKKYIEIERNWLFYCKSAKTKSHVPDMDGMEALKNQVRKINQNPWHHSSNFAYLSTP